MAYAGLDQVEPPKRCAIVPAVPDKIAEAQTHSYRNVAQTAPDNNNTDKHQEESEEGSVDDATIEFTNTLGDKEQTDAADPSVDTPQQCLDLQSN